MSVLSDTDQGTLKYGSDVIVKTLTDQGVRFVALNPGASFRGLHDSLVNRSDAPEIILCPHEKIAVNIAHGFAKATGEPMAAVLHDTVGLLHGTLGVFYAYLDRVPVLLFGGAGPMDTTRRRPQIDWIHTANVQGNAIRDYTKWDDQPVSIGAFPEAMARARKVALAEPAGPVYVAFDAALQEDPVVGPIPSFEKNRVGPATRIGPDPAALESVAQALVASRRPIFVVSYAGRDPEAFSQIPELAELVGAGVMDTGIRLNMPNRHPLNITGTNAIEDADLVLFLDVKDMTKPTAALDSVTRTTRSRIPEDALIIDIGFNELHISSWIQHYGNLREVDIQVTADTVVALPLLIARCRELVSQESSNRAAERQARRDSLAAVHHRRQEAWAEEAQRVADESPVATSRLATEIWEVIRDTDWVLTAGTANDWALRLWDFDRPYRHPGRSLGTATQIGMSLGVALAHRGKGRLVVDIQPDGDLLFDPAALWVASTYRIPMLVVMYNNRAYYNDWEHQIRMAKSRGTPLERAHIGVGISEPYPDFAGIARSFGWHAEGPIDDPNAIRAAIQRAANVVLEQGVPALVDVVCQHR